jgi:hypothetical protein
MYRKLRMGAGAIALVVGLSSGCANNSPTTKTDSPPATGQATEALPAEAVGTLEIRANGEDFVRQGFISKDGWKIEFDHVYATLADVTAAQANPPYEPEKGKELQAQTSVSLASPQTVDLKTTGAETVKVGEVKAPAGRYNALAWKMVKPTDGPAKGYPLLLQGTATKDGKTVKFAIKIDQELAFSCGEFVGDERKGNLKPGEKADLEATFHFDHLFGDAETAATDALNQGALGFAPLAAIATDGQLDADLGTLKQKLAPADYQKFIGVLPSLGHVGEGHCKETVIQAGA